jgi:predicted 3-demethylubiquinone-9 3-methyltransferase (glyoxalase superfamily)
MSKITTFLAFEKHAAEAAALYTSVFPRSKIVRTTHYGEGAPLPAGTVLVTEISLDGQTFQLMNGGPHFEFTDAISLSIDCKTQDEIDTYTEKLTAGGGEIGPCGWVKDRFGVSWQVVPERLGTMLGDSDGAKSQRVMGAMMKMKKLDIAALERAYAG